MRSANESEAGRPAMMAAIPTAKRSDSHAPKLELTAIPSVESAAMTMLDTRIYELLTTSTRPPTTKSCRNARRYTGPPPTSWPNCSTLKLSDSGM
eukprot:3524307-Prymnesium_polylepis.1